MHPSDAKVFQEILIGQTRRSIKGALAEIGVFYGRSFSLLAMNAKDSGETALGLDLFENPDQIPYVENVLKENDLLASCRLEAGSSLDLSPSDVTAMAGPVRFFSVDGGHEMEHILHDSALAAGSVCEQGVIAFDDFMNAQYPDLTVGLIDFLRENADTVRPFAITRAKLYVAPVGACALYQDILESMDLSGGLERDRFKLLGHEVVFIDQPGVNRAVYQKLAERGLGKVGKKLASSLGGRAEIR